MTEAEWSACTDPTSMLSAADGNASRRKLLLFAIACCERIMKKARSKEFLEVVAITERMADGSASSEEWRAAFANLGALVEEGILAARPFAWLGRFFVAATLPASVADLVAGSVAENVVLYDASDTTEERERGHQCALLRDIIGPALFRPLPSDPSWLTEHVTALARTIYDDHAFHLMPILADALEDGGCDNREVLDHCRKGSDHVRGCWVIDSILAKE